MELCQRQVGDEGVEALEAERWQEAADGLADEGFRVLAVAGRPVEAELS